jgi:aryl-alcohol dehydrogenase-like predicted oxidoreductase
MRYKLLGTSGLRVSELGLGTMTFMDGLRWGASKEQSWQIFDAYAEADGNFLDTSNSYGTGETYLGELLKRDRDGFVVATKYTGSTPGEHVNSSGNHRKSLLLSVEASLRRLQTDYLDLLWLNAWDFMTPVEEITRALDDLVRTGKILYVGVSNSPAWFVAYANALAQARGRSPFIALQVMYNLLERDSERELLPMADALDVGVTAWTPLASGWLTGKYPGRGEPAAEQGRLADSGAAGFVRRGDRAFAILDEVVRIARELDCKPAHVALNWLRRKGVVPFFGARTAEQTRENLHCLDVVLPDEQMQSLDQVGRIPLGYPYDFLSSGMVKQHMYGGRFAEIDDHRGRTALLRRTAPGHSRRPDREH